MSGESGHALSRARYELKYVVRHEVATSFIASLASDIEPDPYSANGGYEISSLYYDTHDHKAYFEKLDGVDPRFKARVRTYLPRGASFLELKHRRGDLIHKDRVRISTDTAIALAEADCLHFPATIETSDVDQETRAVMEGFLAASPLRPSCTVRYHRQAYLAHTNPSLRITVDTGLHALGTLGGPLHATENGNLFLPLDLAILELKFHWAVPLWLLEACQEHGLEQRRYSKYCAALECVLPELAMREVRLQDRLR